MKPLDNSRDSAVVMEEVDDLIVGPFKEIADKARQAVDNAGDDNPEMVKAAKSLLKEGERGLKRIEPLCKKYLEDYGSSFTTALKENDDIANYRSDLTNLLWEFDDYIEPDEFDADKFAELQSLSRKAAPKIYDILMRMRLEPPVSDAASSRGSIPQLPTPTSPPVQGAQMLPPPHGYHRGSANSSLADIQDTSAQLRGMMRSPTEGHYDLPSGPPKPPTGNPWDWQAKPGEARTASDAGSQHRRDVDDESPVLPSASLHGDGMRFAVVHPPPPSVAGSAHPDHSGMEVDDRRMSAAAGSSMVNHQLQPRQPQRQPTLSSFSIPEDDIPSSQPGTIPFFQTANVPYSPMSQHSRQPSFPMSEHSDTSEGPRPDLVSLPSHDSRFPRASLAVSPLPGPSVVPVSQAPEAVAEQPSAAMLAEMDCAPIPVVTEESPETTKPAAEQVEECRIDDNSSFNLAKGFCDGAKEVIRGGIGVKRTKKPGFATSATVARCIGCLYELDFAEIETDVNRHDKGNFARNGIHFRVRFLQKSHISTKRIDDVQYACVFCVQQNHTMDKSDATVFFNQKSLFEHLARHPRPLPEVPGFTVIEAERVPEKHKNDYDIHFRQPPNSHPVIDRATEIARLPSGIAKEQARRMYGMRLLYDRSPALELAQGAKITGISFPAQYLGEWCFGWHDGNYASVPVDLVRLEPPPSKEICYDRSSNVRAKARWKFVQRDKEKDKNGEWLKFDKGDTITNIAWAHPDHWCWSGSTSKGKSGIFPAAFLDHSTVQEPNGATGSRLDKVIDEKARSSSSMLSKFSIRKGSGRAQSISAGSTTSH